MPIRLREPVEPTAGAVLGADVGFAESEAYRRLRRELQRYVRREIAGRSFLISGHRGAGKTTLVLKVYEDVHSEFSQRSQPHSPVLVRLQGPDLLPDAETTPGGDGETGDHTPSPPPKEPGRALRQFTLAMYRAVAERFAAEFRQRVLERQTADRPIPHQDLELAASFRLALDDAPLPQVLRDLYRRGGFLQSGVLFSSRDFFAAPRSPPPDQGMRELVALSSAAQAYRMILGEMSGTRASSSEASDQQSREISVQPAIKEALQLVTGLVLGAVVGAGVLSGDGKALAAGLAAAATAAAATFVVKLGSLRSRKRVVKEEDAFVRRYDASTLERELPILVERLHQAGLAPMFMVDELDKVRSLQDLMLPVIDQLKGFVSERAFFCFLTDRDYFEHLRKRILTELYPREHTYFADRLFLFYRPEDLHRYLTGKPGEDPPGDQRGGILEIVGDEPADRTERDALPYLLLQRAKMHPADLRWELQRMRDAEGYVTLARRSGPGLRGPAETSGLVTTDLGYQLSITVQLAVEHLLDREELRRRIDQDPHFAQSVSDALYYVSREWEKGCKELDLSKQTLTKYLDQRIDPVTVHGGGKGKQTEEVDGGENEEMATAKLAPGAGAGRTARTRASLAVEDDPGQGRGEGSDEPGSPLALATRERLLDPLQAAAEDGSGSEEAAGESTSRLPSADLDDLHRLVKELVALLCDPPDLLQEIAAARSRRQPPIAALNAVPRKRCFLAPVAGTEDRYRFLVDPFGRPPLEDKIEPAGEPTVSPRDAFGEPVRRPDLASTPFKMDFIRRLDAFIQELTGSLDLYRCADTLFILSTSPAWPQVRQALSRLDAFLKTGESSASIDEDLRALDDYIVALHQRFRILALSLVYGSILGQADGSEDPARRRARGIRTLAASLGFARRPSQDDLVKTLDAYAETVRPEVRASVRGDEKALNDLGLERFDKWQTEEWEAAQKKTEQWTETIRKVVDEYQDRLEAEILADLQRQSWERWRERCEKFLSQRVHEFEPTEEDLLCLVAGRAPATLLRLDLARMSLPDWSRALRLALAAPSPEDIGGSPAWLAPVSLVGLNVRPAISPPFLMHSAAKIIDPTLAENPEDHHWRQVVGWIERRPTIPSGSDQPVVVILASETDSLTESWSPGRRFGAVVVPQDLDAGSAKILELLHAAANEAKTPMVLLLEIDSRFDGAKLAEMAATSALRQSRALLLARSRRDLSRIGETQLRALGFSHSILKPKDVDDAVEQALHIITPS